MRNIVTMIPRKPALAFILFSYFAVALFLGCAGGGTSGTSGTHSRTLYSLINVNQSDGVTLGDAELSTESGDVIGGIPLNESGKVEFNTVAGDISLSLQTNVNKHSIVLNNLESQGSILLLRGELASASVEFMGDSYEFALRAGTNCERYFFENASLYLSDTKSLPDNCTFEPLVKKNGMPLPRAIVNVYQGNCELPFAYNTSNAIGELVTDVNGIAASTLPLEPLELGKCYTFQALTDESMRTDIVLQVVP